MSSAMFQMLRSVKFKDASAPSLAGYPFTIPAVRGLDGFAFDAGGASFLDHRRCLG